MLTKKFEVSHYNILKVNLIKYTVNEIVDPNIFYLILGIFI